jgi:thioesterase domain-containing protein/acyl carrier protein
LPEIPQTANPSVEVDADPDAYVFYTSGSTGNPKGVRQTQRNVQHFVDVYSRTLGITCEDRLTLFYSLAFSASNMDVFGALLNGAELFPYDIRNLGTAALGDWLDDNGITILHAVPTVYRHLLRQMPPGRILKTVRGVDLGGEAVYAADLELHREHFHEDCILVNHLAATEASVIAQEIISTPEARGGKSLSVGLPAEGMEIEIVDAAGQAAPPGETGEIVLRSRYISPGYFGRPDLDAKAFTDLPDRPGWRTYKSGDLGYLSEDGRLHFLGRKDHRVKVRGYTVDTAEIELAIRASADVRDVAVVLQEDPVALESGRLVAFLASEGGLRVDLNDLRESLRRKLPAYMIPVSFAVLDSLPTTPSGKLDRNKLAVMEVTENRDDCSDDPPVGETEKAVAALFKSLLKLKRVSRGENFFQIGGDSLSATVLHVRLENAFQKSIPLGKLFVDPTVRGIAGLMATTECRQNRELPPVLVPLRETGRHMPMFLTHGARGQAFVSPHFLSIIGDEQPVYALQATGLAPEEMKSIPRMAASYVKAIREVRPHGPYFIGALCIGSLLAIEMARQLREAGETVGPLVLIDPPPNPPADRSIYKRNKELLIARFQKFKSCFGTDQRFIRQVRKRASQGRINIDPYDENAMRESQRATLDFKLALLRYRLPFYDGPVFILGTTSRLGKAGAAEASILMKRLVGESRIFNVGPKHGEIHDVGNELFALRMKEVVEETIKYFADATPMPHPDSGIRSRRCEFDS